jgi:hypothetical protein
MNNIYIGGVFLFAVLQINDEEVGFVPTIKKYLSKSQIDIERVTLSECQPFFIVTTMAKGGKVPWKAVEYSLGRLSDRMILPKGVKPPENSAVKVIDFTYDLTAQMLLNTAISISNQNTLASQRQSIAIVDRKGIYFNKIEKIVKSVSIVRIVTDKVERYEEIAKEMYYKWGASISVSDDINLALQSDMIVSPFEQITKTNALVFSTDLCKNATHKTLISPKITLPNNLNLPVLKNIDEHSFVSALYEFCGCKKLEQESFRTMFFYNQEKSVSELSKMIKYETV